MKFKLISTKEMEKLYPSNYNEELLKQKGLKDNSLNSNFRYTYSYYRFYLEYYINELLDLKSIEEKINEENLSIDVSFLYKDISALEYKNIFLRNNLFIERLTIEEIKSINEGIKNKDTNKVYEIIKNTFKKVIPYDEEKESSVIYDINLLDHLASNKALVFGVIVKDKTNETIKKYLEEKEKEFASIIKIPVKIFMYDYLDIINYEVYSVSNLNEKEEKENEELLKANPKYLPIGSVIILKGALKKLMIVGQQMENIESKTVYDYIGYLYPEGYVGKDKGIGFNHEDISKIYALGLNDKEQKDYLELLK